MYATSIRQLLHTHTNGTEAIGGLSRQGCVWIGISSPQLEYGRNSCSETNKTCGPPEKRIEGYYGAYPIYPPGHIQASLLTRIPAARN